MQFLAMLFLLILLKTYDMTLRDFALCHSLRCPPPMSDCPHCFVIHRRKSFPLYFPPSAPIHILVSCSAAVPSSSATIIYRPPQSPHRPLLTPLPSPLHCQFAPSASSSSAASFVPATVSFASPPRLLHHIFLLFCHRLICCPGPLLRKIETASKLKQK